jgi:hypothetical protein
VSAASGGVQCPRAAVTLLYALCLQRTLEVVLASLTACLAAVEEYVRSPAYAGGFAVARPPVCTRPRLAAVLAGNWLHALLCV